MFFSSECPAPNALEHGTVKNDGGITVGQQATYECNKGYNLIGEFKRICQLNSTWSGEEPVCTAKGNHRVKLFQLLVTTKRRVMCFCWYF